MNFQKNSYVVTYYPEIGLTDKEVEILYDYFISQTMDQTYSYRDTINHILTTPKPRQFSISDVIRLKEYVDARRS